MAGRHLSEANEEHQQPAAPQLPENGCLVGPELPSSSVLHDFDGCVLPFLGGLAKYQKRVILLTWIPMFIIGLSQHSDTFLLALPKFTCKVGISGSNLQTPGLPVTSIHSGHQVQGITTTTVTTAGVQVPTSQNSGNVNASQCQCQEWIYEVNAGLNRNVVTKWNLVCDSSWKVDIAKFSLLVGSIFGYLITGMIADWFGRRPVLIFSVAFILVFGLTVALSVDITMFSTLRFFEGFCLAGITLSLYIIRIEICPPDHRFMITMIASFIAMAGQLVMPGLAVLCKDWQVLQAVIICPIILMISYWCIYPESLRWLMATYQFNAAKKWILRCTRVNKMNMETETDVKNVMPELEKELVRKPKKICIVKVVGTRNLWKNIVVLCVNSLTGFGIHHCFARSIMEHKETMVLLHNFYADYYTRAAITIASCVALCPVVGFLGRRGGLLLFTIFTALASLLQLGLLNLIGKYAMQPDSVVSDTVKDKFSIVFSIIGMFSSHAVGSLSIFFCAEVTPTVIRFLSNVEQYFRMPTILEYKWGDPAEACGTCLIETRWRCWSCSSQCRFRHVNCTNHRAA
ncbi:solute carrier family 22 member 23 isoform X2 [Protopterus annectens]|uniref:solute carrier family 22 member 23 isoform X2 n=1 Tax=Protopterus annectens TaxID=7888 RepID=UPI001CFA8325|nr:solute carrier family 22 member 23 isoform X2 [Protopterus annectens]